MCDKSLQIRSMHSADELTPHLDAWRTLAAGAPMRSPEWLMTWWEIFAEPEDQLFVILVHGRDGAMLGLAPLYLQRRGGYTTIRMLGAADNCTHHGNWLSALGWEIRIGKEVARFLLQCRRDWQRLWLEAVDAEAESVHVTMKYLIGHGCLGHRRQINSCWKIRLPDTWDEYLQKLSRSLRKRCRKLQRDFFDSGKIRLRRVETAADLQEGFEVLLELHAARWGTTSQPVGAFSDAKFRAFHENVAQILRAEGQLRLVWLECQGKPVAAEYQFFDTKSVYAYQAGLDLTMDQCAPGKLSMMAAIQFAIARDCEFFDLLRGNEAYKTHWRAEPVACYDLRIWQRGIRTSFEWAAWHAYMYTAERLKPLLPESLVTRVCQLFAKIRGFCRPRRRLKR